MRTDDKFWENKTLAEMDSVEWESLCDHCGLCCLLKAEDEDSGDVYNTRVICAQYDCNKAQCGCYGSRTQANPDCISLTIELVEQFQWLPESCAYRRLARGESLPAWHPLNVGHRNDVPNVVERYQKTGLIAWSSHIDLADHIVGEKIYTAVLNEADANDSLN